MTPAERLRARLKPRFRILWLLGSVTLLTLVGWNSCTAYIAPGEVGVKQVIIGADQGVHQEVLGPGTHWLTPGAERMHRFPADLQVLEMSDTPSVGDSGGKIRVIPAIKIQTSEGYTVSVDITVLYRIDDAYKVMTQIGPGRQFEDSAVVPRAQQQLRRTFGELDAEEFYKGDKREKAAIETQRLLQEELEPKGIKVTHILVRSYRYDERYQKAIEQRKVQDQTVFKNQAEAQAATEEAKKNKIIAEGTAAVEVELARGDAQERHG